MNPYRQPDYSFDSPFTTPSSDFGIRALARCEKDALGVFVTKEDALVVKAIREASREVDFIASTATVDAHGDVIEQATWQLDQYRDNPVVLYGHQAYDLPIGQCTYVGLEQGRLVCTIKFSEATQRAKEVWALVVEKTLRAVSVGFRPVNGGYEMRDGQEVWVWKNPILKEISVVAIPANHEALAKTKAAFIAAIQKSPVPPAQPATHTSDGDAGAATQERTEVMKTIEQLQKELDDNKAATAAKIAELNTKLVETEQRAEKAEARVGITEKSEKAATDRVAKLEAEATIREKEHTQAVTDRDAAVKKADELDTKLITLEVDALIGKKIAPTEREEFIELRKSNEKLFKSMVDKRADMHLTERVTAPDEKAAGTKETTPTQKSGDAQASEVWNNL